MPIPVRACCLQVHATLCALGVPCQLEHTEAGEYSIDIALPEHRISGGWSAGAVGGGVGGWWGEVQCSRVISAFS